jgi:hypothetical protein
MFYFVDDQRKITKLRKMKDSHWFNEEKEFFIKRQERRQLVIPAFSDNLIVDDYYIMSGTRIFYLYEETPFPEGICDMEDLIEMDDIED